MLQADFCFTGNGIDCHEAKAFDLTELEWIRLHDSQAVISELFSDHRNLFHRNTERRQVYHEITQGFRFPVGFDDSLEFFLGNPLDAMLRSLSPPVSIYFETENINTLSQNGELLLTVLAAFAQDESVNKSISVAWGIRQRFAKGIPKLVKPYGYQLEGNKLIVDEDEAGVVIRIFAFYLGGKTPYEIAKILTSEGIPSPAGKSHWTVSSVTYILGNDRYCGDIIMQKSICVDLFAHKRVRNLGQAERFRVRDAHTPLVSKEDWREVKNRVSMPDREAVILEDITGEGVLAELHPIQFKEDVDI